MSALVKLSDKTWAYLTEKDLTEREMQYFKDTWEQAMGRTMVVIHCDEFIDVTGAATFHKVGP